MKKLKYILLTTMVMGFLFVAGQQIPSTTPVDETGPVVDKDAQATPDKALTLPGRVAPPAEVPGGKSDFRDETMPPDNTPSIKTPVKNEQELREDSQEQPSGPDEATGPVEVKPDKKQP
ncbi:MAG: hypothetical protein KBC43_05845 [Bacteroidales bacterium]|nr:hypothetical protein [Bacteroidales bacterium]